MGKNQPSWGGSTEDISGGALGGTRLASGPQKRGTSSGQICKHRKIAAEGSITPPRPQEGGAGLYFKRSAWEAGLLGAEKKVGIHRLSRRDPAHRGGSNVIRGILISQQQT